MKKVLAVVPEELAPGFLLAGVEVRTPSPEDFPNVLEEEMVSGRWGLIIADAEYESTLSPQRRAEVFESTDPVVVFVSTKGGGEPPEEYISRVIREAMGYAIKVRG